MLFHPIYNTVSPEKKKESSILRTPGFVFRKQSILTSIFRHFPPPGPVRVQEIKQYWGDICSMIAHPGGNVYLKKNMMSIYIYICI